MDAEYKDMNESAPIPSLTLEPELENTPKLVVAEETKLQQTKVAEPVLTPQEQQMVDDFAQKIDVENTAQILQYGAGTQKKMADFSDAALANVRTQDLGEVGDLIVNVVGELKGFDAEEEKGFFGFFGRLFHRQRHRSENRKSQGHGNSFDGTRMQLHAASARSVRLCEHQHDFVTGLMQCG